jgi:hypothetical protein
MIFKKWAMIFNTLRSFTKLPLFKDVEHSSLFGKEVLDELNNTQHQLTEVILLCSSSLVHFAG